MSKKYELIESEFVVNWLGKKLFRIRALVDIKLHNIKAGDKGGYVESERSLSQEGNAWVSGDARVYGNAWVYGNARVSKPYQLVNITNLRHSFTSLPKGIQVGCQFYSMHEWKEKHKQVGKAHGMSPELSEAYYKLMVAVRRIQRLEHLDQKKASRT